MKRTSAILVLCATFFGNGCSKTASDSVVYVTVTAPAGLPPVTQLRVNLACAGRTDTELFPSTNSTKAISFAPAATFVLDLPHSSSGNIDIAIDALSGAGSLVSHGEKLAAIVSGGRTDITVVLGSGNGGDGGIPSLDASGTMGTGGNTGTDGNKGTGGIAGTGGTTHSGDDARVSDAADDQPDTPIVRTGGNNGTGGMTSAGGVTSAGGSVGTGGSSVGPPSNTCGNGIVETGELCDCGNDATKLPIGCEGVNGLFYGDGKGCSKTCTKEPNCQDGSGNTQACTTSCGDGNLDPGEGCDDGNQVSGDGCSSTCQVEAGFTCATTTQQDSSTCQSGSGQCLELPVIYRDFQPENVSPGGHPDFFFLGTKMGGSKSPTTICVPNSGGPAKGNDSTTRCWGIVGSTLLNGKPQPGSTTTCACQFSDWSIGNTSHIPTTYTQAGNDSPLSDGNGGYLGGNVGTPVSVTGNAGVSSGTLTGYTASSPGGPIWKGTTPAYKNEASFNQWFNDDSTVNKTFTSVLELNSIGTNIYQYASTSYLAQGGVFPLDTLNTSQVTMCNLWPYWNHGNGNPIWPTCTGDQFLYPPRVIQSDCPNQIPLTNGCWVTAVPGVKHDFYFTAEARYFFVYDGTAGINLQFFGDDDLFIFINGKLVLDLGGVHQQLPGKVTVTGSPGDAQVTEGGCLDAVGNITGVTAGSNACSPTNSTPPTATTPDDFRVHTVPLGLVTGKVYEIAIFGANRQAPYSNFQITLNGYTTKRSICQPSSTGTVGSGGTGGVTGTGGIIGTGGTPSSGGTTTSQGGSGGINPFAGGTTGSTGGATGTGGTTTVTSTPTGTTVAFGAGKAQGAMLGYGWVDLGLLDTITNPTCGATKVAITHASPCTVGLNWSATDKLCLSGSVPALASTNPDYVGNWGVSVGVNSTDSAGGVLGQSFSTITIATSGVPSSTVRAQVHRKGDTDATSYCLPYTTDAMTLTKFAIDCYNATPAMLLAAADIPNIDKVSLEAVSGSAAVTVTSMCITGITFAK